MSAHYTLQVIDRTNYSKQHIVTLPDDPLPALPPNSLRIQTKIISLTTNNFSYARMGHILGWWDVHPLPSNTPAPYNDPASWGCISGWGYAEIIESTVPDIPKGMSLYGYIPIGTLPTDITIESSGFKNQITVLNPHRQHLWKIYNRYEVCPPLADLEKQKGAESLAWDSIMQPLFGTSYNLNRYGYAWEEGSLTHPSGTNGWTLEDANLDDTAVVLLSASTKTAMAFAHQLRHGRPEDHRPKLIVAVGSSSSQPLVNKSAFYDHVFLYSEAEKAKAAIEKASPRRIVVVEYGSRAGAAQAYIGAISQVATPAPFGFLATGGEVKPESPEETSERFKMFAASKIMVVNASYLREKGIETGGQTYWDEFYAEWERFKQAGAIKGLQFQWGQGLNAFKESWDKLCADEVPKDHGLVFRF